MHKGSRSMQKANQLFAYVKCTKECILYKKWIDFSVYIAHRIVYSIKKKERENGSIEFSNITIFPVLIRSLVCWLSIFQMVETLTS